MHTDVCVNTCIHVYMYLYACYINAYRCVYTDAYIHICYLYAYYVDAYRCVCIHVHVVSV